jgi:hypothetical protein
MTLFPASSAARKLAFWSKGASRAPLGVPMSQPIHRRATPRLAALVAVGLGLALTGAVHAQTAAPAEPAGAGATAKPAAPPPPRLYPQPSQEALRLGTVLADCYLDVVQAGVLDQMTKAGFDAQVAKLGDRAPEVQRYIKESLVEALAETHPHLEAIIAHALAWHYSEGELRAGVDFMSGPGGLYVLDSLAHAAAGDKSQPPPSPAVEAAMKRMERSAEGRKFLSDSVHVDVVLQPYQRDILAAFGPPFALTFAEKVEAGEARRAAAAAPTDPTVEAQARALVHGLYRQVDAKAWTLAEARLDEAIAKSATDTTNLPPEWPHLFAEATLETLRQDQPAIEAATGRALARLLDADEIKALDALANSPAPAYLAQVVLALQRKEQPPQLPPEVAAALQAFVNSGVGDRLTKQIQDKDRVKAAGLDLLFAVGPLWLHRFAEKAEAAEKAHRAARGW